MKISEHPSRFNLFRFDGKLPSENDSRCGQFDITSLLRDGKRGKDFIFSKL
jgi:hypothetical protein